MRVVYEAENLIDAHLVKGLLEHHGIPATEEEWRPKALEWATTRGARSGRTAYQFVQDLAGRLEQPLEV